MRTVNTEFDCIVIGSGPAGVSVSFPLLEAGKKVLMVDGGRTANVPLPDQPYLAARTGDQDQWRWFSGDARAAVTVVKGSPKLRVPTQQFAFDGFCQANRIETRDFNATGSLAAGGLSNAWGCGVASLSDSELDSFPAPAQEMRSSYATIANRIGISGRSNDDLSAYFGLDEWSQAPIALDANHQYLVQCYQRKKALLSEHGFLMGRSRVAVLTEGKDGRESCDLSANCLWGCHRGSTWSAAQDLEKLKLFPGFEYQPGVVIEKVSADGGLNRVLGTRTGQGFSAKARQVLLAAGTLATTAIVLRTTNNTTRRPLQNCPNAAFLLWLPRHLGAARVQAFGLGQLSFTLALAENETAFGSTFNTTGLPVAEFLRAVPFNKRSGINLLRGLLSSCVVANVFLPGHYSTSTMTLKEDGAVLINGGFKAGLPATFQQVQKRLRAAFARLGAYMIPGSFTPGETGSDIHYAATLPMREHPDEGETGPLGELPGLPGVHVVDGACLPVLSEKSHTLTIMANADRIGRALASGSQA